MSSNVMRNVSLAVLTTMVAFLLVAVGFLARVVVEPEAETIQVAAPAETLVQTTIDYQLIGEILAILEQDFVEPDRVDYEYLFEGAIQGVFEGRGIPSTGDACPATVGGVAELPEVAGSALESGGSSGETAGLLASVTVAVATVALALGGAAWYARRRAR